MGQAGGAPGGAAAAAGIPEFSQGPAQPAERALEEERQAYSSAMERCG